MLALDECQASLVPPEQFVLSIPTDMTFLTVT